MVKYPVLIKATSGRPFEVNVIRPAVLEDDGNYAAVFDDASGVFWYYELYDTQRRANQRKKELREKLKEWSKND